MAMDIQLADTAAPPGNTPGGNPFSDLTMEEKRELARAIGRAERLSDAERTAGQLVMEALAVERSMEARGVTDPAARREAADAVAIATSSEHALDREVSDYRGLLGGENRMTVAAGQYVQLLQNARAGDIEALNTVQAARSELTEAEMLNATVDKDGGRYRILSGTELLQTNSARDALAAYELAASSSRDVTVIDADRENQIVASANVVGPDDRHVSPALQAAANAESRIEAAMTQDQQESPYYVQVKSSREAASEAERISVKIAGNEVELNGAADEKRIENLRDVELAARNADPDSDAAHAAIRARKAAELASMQREQNEQYPEGFERRYFKDGNRVLDINRRDVTVMQDKGSRLQAPQDFTAETVQLMVDTAEARSWKTLNVKGSAQFREAVWTAAVSKGLDVAGYMPTPTQQAWAEAQRERSGKTNTVTQNEAVKAFKEAGTPTERQMAAQKFPELKKAFAMEAAVSAFAKQHVATDKAREALMSRMRDTIAMDIAQGRQLADIRLIKPMSKEQPYNRDQDRGRDR